MRMRVLGCLLGAIALLAVPASAWGPKTQSAIVSTAAQILSRGGSVGLQKTLKDLQQGATVSQEQLRELYPDVDTNPLGAIEQEINLLSAVRGDRIEPYFAFRLGTLGKVVANFVAPMQNSSATFRNLYYSDIDKMITEVTLEPGSRDVVAVMNYLPQVQSEAAVNDPVIEREYESGAGFSDVARSTVGRDTSRAVDAVADVMYTVVTGRAAAGGASDAQKQRYVLSAYEYYIRRKNPLEIMAAAERLNSLVEKTPEMREKIGDMFFAAGMQEEAMKEYGEVVAAAPERGQVAAKMGDYYIEQGKKALEEERYQEALSAFQQAVDANPLNGEASRFRLQAERAMQDKEARQAAAQASIQHAEELVKLAEQEAGRKLYAEATSLLNQALDAYSEAGEEFPQETQARRRGEEHARARMQDFKRELIANARVFSGSGYAQDLRDLAAHGAPDLDKRALQELLKNEYQAHLQQLETQLRADDAR